MPNSNDMPGFALYDGDKVIDETVDQGTLTGRYTAAALSFIDDWAGKRPFFLFLAHTFPHIPLFASPAFAGKSAAGRYGDVVEELDASVGQIVAALRDQGVLDNTLIVFTSDNGPFFEGDPGPAHGGKGSTWDGGYRVPFIARWPERLPAGRIATQISMNIDILPTLADIAGIRGVPLPLDGRSLLGILQGSEDSLHEHLLYFAAEDIVAIRDAQWKLVTHAWFRSSFVAFEKLDRLDGFLDPYVMLFDMNGNPGERYSLADREPGVTQRLGAALAAARAEFAPLRLEAPSRTFPD